MGRFLGADQAPYLVVYHRRVHRRQNRMRGADHVRHPQIQQGQDRQKDPREHFTAAPFAYVVISAVSPVLVPVSVLLSVLPAPGPSRGACVRPLASDEPPACSSLRRGDRQSQRP